MNGLQRTMLGMVMAGAASFGVGTSLTGCQKQHYQYDTVRVPKYVTVHDTIIIPKPEYKFDIKIPRLIDLVEEARKPAAEFVENGLKLLRKIR